MQQPQANAMPSARRRSPAVRVRKGHAGLPPWPNKPELEQAEIGALLHMAVEINRLVSPQDPTKGPIKHVEKQALAVEIALFWQQSVDGLRPNTEPPDTLSPSQKSAQAAAAGWVAAAGPPAAGAPAAVVANAGGGALPGIMQGIITQGNAAMPSIGKVLRTIARLQCWFFTFFLWAIALYTLIEMYLASSEPQPDYHNMGGVEAWNFLMKNSQHQTGLYWVKVLPKLCIAWNMGAFQGFTTQAFPCRMLFLSASIFCDCGWGVLQWIELPVLCFFACALITAQLQAAGMFTLYVVKYLFWSWGGKEVGRWLLYELVCFYLLSFLIWNKILGAMYKSCQMSFKSFEDIKIAKDFFGSESIVLSDGTIDPNPNHPLRKLTQQIKRTPINHLWGLLGLPAPSGGVNHSEIEQLWRAHNDNTTRVIFAYALSILVCIRQCFA